MQKVGDSMDRAKLKQGTDIVKLDTTRKLEQKKLKLLATREWVCTFCGVDVVLSSYRPDNKKEPHFKAKHTHKPYCEQKRAAQAAVENAKSLEEVKDIPDIDLVTFGHKIPISGEIIPEVMYKASTKHLKRVMVYMTGGQVSGYLYNYKHPYFTGFCFWSKEEIDLTNSKHIVFFILRELIKKPERYGTKNWASKFLIFKEVSV